MDEVSALIFSAQAGLPPVFVAKEQKALSDEVGVAQACGNMSMRVTLAAGGTLFITPVGVAHIIAVDAAKANSNIAIARPAPGILPS